MARKTARKARKGNPNVAKAKTSLTPMSGDKMASVPHVNLGSTYGNHDVAHATK